MKKQITLTFNDISRELLRETAYGMYIDMLYEVHPQIFEDAGVTANDLEWFLFGGELKHEQIKPFLRGFSKQMIENLEETADPYPDGSKKK